MATEAITSTNPLDLLPKYANVLKEGGFELDNCRVMVDKCPEIGKPAFFQVLSPSKVVKTSLVYDLQVINDRCVRVCTANSAYIFFNISFRKETDHG